jgi:hypothetical protein
VAISIFYLPSNGIFFAGNLTKCFTFRTSLLLDNVGKRKGKLVEKRGRKATGLKLKSHDSRVAETGDNYLARTRINLSNGFSGTPFL